jgi:hypothetical protein
MFVNIIWLILIYEPFFEVIPNGTTQGWVWVGAFIVTSVNPVHNAQVCYFNNVWFMFLVF